MFWKWARKYHVNLTTSRLPIRPLSSIALSLAYTQHSFFSQSLYVLQALTDVRSENEAAYNITSSKYRSK